MLLAPLDTHRTKLRGNPPRPVKRPTSGICNGTVHYPGHMKNSSRSGVGWLDMRLGAGSFAIRNHEAKVEQDSVSQPWKVEAISWNSSLLRQR
jgi:hypothetical protein